MGELKPKMAASIRKIRHVFMHDWDPIGVGAMDDWPEDEYDGYVMPMYSLLRQRKTRRPFPRISHKYTSTSWVRVYRQRLSRSPLRSSYGLM